MENKHKTITVLHREEISREKTERPVRIDHKTVILVGPDVSDDEARQGFFMKQEQNRKKFEDKRHDRTRNQIKPTEIWE